ncbi:MAG: hypothetical protein QNI97_08235 [Desulfobacterales bacterium]|nr:hypothetical protein [Desulfobacterales bacterium]
MAGNSLVAGAAMQCPHGGTVQVAPANSAVRADKDAVVLTSDIFTVSGCLFQIPAVTPIPSPCVQVRWLVADTRVKINGQATLSETSTGICLSAAGVAQGPVIITNTQRKVSSM